MYSYNSSSALIRHRMVLFLLVISLTPLSAASCSKPNCSQGLHEYKGECLSNVAIQYLGCTDGRGINVTEEIKGDTSVPLEKIAQVSLDVAYKRTQQENTPVALQIVRDCWEIAKTTSPPDDPEQAAAARYQRELEDALAKWQGGLVKNTPDLTLSRANAKRGDRVTVTGTNFLADENVNIYISGILIARVRANQQGGFSTIVTVPSDGLNRNLSTSITAAGQSSARSASAPFHVDAPDAG